MFHPLILVRDKLKTGGNAYHTLFTIVIKRLAKEPAAILFQEVVEWAFLWKARLVYLAVFIIAGLYIPFPSWIENFLYHFAVAMGSLFFHRLIPPLAREMELRGKTCEAVAAADFYGVSFHVRMHSEAKSLTRYSQFKGWTLERIEAAMWKKVAYAQNRVDRNGPWIKLWKEKLS